MAAGLFEAGADEAGELAAAPEAPVTPTMPLALRLNPETRKHVLNSDGAFASLHPVDSQVVNALFIVSKALRSSPETGNGLRGLGSPRSPRARAFVEDQVRLALKDLISGGDIQVLGIEFEPSSYTAKVGVDYVNLRLPLALQVKQRVNSSL